MRAKIAGGHISSAMNYAKTIAELTGTVNSGSMFSGEYAAGELLFAGASGDIVGDDPTLVFTFLASKNVTGLSIGGITGIAKNGHDYLWFLFDTEKDSATNLLVSSPRACYVDRIYGEADHTQLHIGAAAP